ncbi:MAG: EpsG family protein [Colwellia sp.]
MIVVVLFFSILISFRPLDAGNDTSRYASTFDQLIDFLSAHSVGEDYFGNTELGFWPFSYLIKMMGFDSSGFIFVIGCLSLSLIIMYSVLISREGNREFSIILFSLLGSYIVVYLGNHVRASLAIPLVFIMFCWVGSQRRLATMSGIIALLFHFSSIFAFPFLILRNKLNRSFWIAYILAMYLLSKFVLGVVLIVSPYLPFLGKKIELYFLFNKVAEFDSIFSLTNFKILSLLVGMIFVLKSNTIWARLSFYLYGLILALSIVPQVSERIFPFLMFVLPVALYDGLKLHFDNSMVALIMFLVFSLNLALVFSAESARYTLALVGL